MLFHAPASDGWISTEYLCRRIRHKKSSSLNTIENYFVKLVPFDPRGRGRCLNRSSSVTDCPAYNSVKGDWIYEFTFLCSFFKLFIRSFICPCFNAFTHSFVYQVILPSILVTFKHEPHHRLFTPPLSGCDKHRWGNNNNCNPVLLTAHLVMNPFLLSVQNVEAQGMEVCYRQIFIFFFLKNHILARFSTSDMIFPNCHTHTVLNYTFRSVWLREY